MYSRNHDSFQAEAIFEFESFLNDHGEQSELNHFFGGISKDTIVAMSNNPCLKAQFFSTNKFSADTASIHFLTGHYDKDGQNFFIKVPEEFSTGRDLVLLPETLNAFSKMRCYAAFCLPPDKMNRFKIQSAVRGFDYQVGNWNSKFKKSKATFDSVFDYNSIPGSSRHHWGTDFDFAGIESMDKDVLKWMETHASEFGFFRPYRGRNPKKFGYRAETWHWSYMPVASKLLDNFNQRVSKNEITNDQLWDTARSAGAINLPANARMKIKGKNEFQPRFNLIENYIRNFSR